MATLTWSMIAKTHIAARLHNVADALRRDGLLIVERSCFVLRCAMAASLAYGAATSVGLPHPVWAPISALVVSQESVSATLASIYGRCAGTLIGVVVALLVNWLGGIAGISLLIQIAVAVALCAIVAMERPTIRVCLWTCPLVLITAPSGPAPDIVAMLRGSEVVLGVVVGGLTHILEQKIKLADMARRLGARVPSVPSKPSIRSDFDVDPDHQRRL